ncbi:MAG: hypothetical protein WBC74_00185 [Candidatus Omnitrophota bacterium]
MEKEIRCPYCDARDAMKFGIRKYRFYSAQKFRCKSCNKNFTDKELSHISYPAKVILKAISLYNLGYPQKHVIKEILRRYDVKVPQRTISEWLKRYSNPCTYHILRKEAIKLFKPKDIILSEKLEHKQVYNFKLHLGKLALLQERHALKEEKLKALRAYLNRVIGKEKESKPFPHHIFTIAPEDPQEETRASKLNIELLKITKQSKSNFANKLADLAIKASPNNYKRHENVQDFMLINDSVTIATEVPVYLTRNDISYFKRSNFNFNFKEYKTPITGHIDILQIRNGLIYILDYKPEASKINPIKQLTIYALSLASRTKLPVKDFKCAWFDPYNYYEFFPLKAVYCPFGASRNDRRLGFSRLIPAGPS